MALIVYRLMRMWLKAAGSRLSPETVLQNLRSFQRDSVCIDGATPITGISTIHPDQANTLAALKLKKPCLDAQLALL